MKSHHMSPRRGQVEVLEKRELLAGDVLVSVVHGNLLVQGDDANNQIAITAGADANSYVITGLDGTNLHLVENGSGTPGPATNVLTVTVRGGAKIRLGDGDDSVAVDQADLSGKLSISTGSGSDNVQIGAALAGATRVVGTLPDAAVALRRSLSVDTGDGDDDIVVANAAIRGRLHIDAGDGNDPVQLGTQENGDAELGKGTLPEASLYVKSSVRVALGDGDDELALAGVKAYSNIHVNGGRGGDTIGVDSADACALSVLGGGGDGNDTVNLANVRARHVGVMTGDGNDAVSVTDSVFASLGVMLGEGDDALATGTITARLGVFLGGLGEDTLDELAASDVVHNLVNGFELGDILDNVDTLGRRGLYALRELVDDLLPGCNVPPDLSLPRLGTGSAHLNGRGSLQVRV